MPILSNQGRTVPELPSISSADISNNDLLIIQNLASNSTKRSSVYNFCTKAADVITKFNNLKFSGTNNSFTGSINNVIDVYSVLEDGIPNIVKRLKVLNYIELGKNSSENSGFKSYVNDFIINQTQKGGNPTIQLLGNGGGTSNITIQNYPGGLNVVNTPLTAETIFANAFVGNLTGNVTGNINYNGIGQSYFFNLNVDNQLTVAYTTINNADINGGTIDGTIIGNSLPSRITGSKILANNGIKGNLTGNVTGDLTGNVAGDLYGNVTGNVLGDVTGNLYGNVDVLSTGILGTSQFWDLNVNNSLTVSSGQFYNVNIDTGTIDNCVIGSTLPSRITGSKILANNGIKGNLTGNVTGNVTGNLTGNVTGNVTATTVAADIFVGGEFSGTTVTAANINGNLLGNVRGNVNSLTNQLVLNSGTGDPKLSEFYGTASYSLSNLTSSYALKAITVEGTVPVATYALNATSAQTSSYVQQYSNIRTNALAYYNGTQLIGNPDLTYKDYGSGVKYTFFSGSNRINAFCVDSQPTNNTLGGQSYLILSLNQNRKNRDPGAIAGPELWRFLLNLSGSYYFQSFINSFNFNNKNYQNYAISQQQNIANAMKITQNNLYLWNDPWSYSSVGRDGALGLGVAGGDSVDGSSPLLAKFQMNIFSASVDKIGAGNWAGNATTRHFDTAILIRYGSGSALNNTFVVSSKGGIYTAGNANFSGYTTSSFRGRPGWTLNGRSVSFWGTGSHSVSSSYSARSFSSSFATRSVTSSFAKQIPYQLYKNTAYGGRNNGTLNCSGNQPYNFPANPTGGSSDPREQPFNIPAGKTTRWFKINGSIKSTSTTPMAIYGIQDGNGSCLLQDTTLCSLGWGNTFTIPVGSVLPFTIEGPYEVIGPQTGLYFKVLSTPGLQMSGYVVLYYDN